MTAPAWLPAPNPGGDLRRFTRHALKAWFDAAAIPGLERDRIWSGDPGPARLQPGEYNDGGRFACALYFYVPDDSETRRALTGPDNFGGKLWHGEVEAVLYHFGFDAGDWPGSEDDYDRVMSAIVDALHADGRTIGRPDVVLQVGEWPVESSIRRNHTPPAEVSGAVMRIGTTYFTTSIYQAQNPA